MSKQQPCESNDNLSDPSIESNDNQYWGLSNARAGSGCGNADDAQDSIASTPTTDLATFLSCHGSTAEEIDGAMLQAGADVAKLAELGAAREGVQQRVDGLYAEWEELEALSEAAM